MDIATVVGVLAGFALIIGAILSGGSLKIFVNVPSLLIVVGGMLCSVLIHFSLGQFLAIFAVIKNAFFHKAHSPVILIQQMVNFAAINRRDGALALEQEMRKVDDPFLVKGLQALVDGQEEDDIRALMGMETEYMQARHGDGKKILEFMGASAPAFGMVGTLIGLVQMLQNMSSPDDIGQGMATALLTTFYGALLANLVFIPMAGKLGQYSKSETLAMEMITEGVCAIVRGDSPTVVREKMQAFVSASKRADVKVTI
ncbi:Chemotaxis protein PomA [Anaerohalosphaera lusitana]|uniref:Chemotaxis protein PomA n=1 Tax=Anaerohalosphaera lusitana TaxID=1936003 RepID=A0A1U9NH24_9BACT|nr:MotA/TolQ/ExbB proton channel family protein [Anaerohalosphaera lusitana]AQT66900.1 Chemotaxis protein PomA [Anaerohalosphaera lusitana]